MGHELKLNKQVAVTYSTDRENEVSKMLYLFETEWNWKAHHKVKRAVSLECGSFNELPKHYPWCDVDTKN